jgi:hypothetical protein
MNDGLDVGATVERIMAALAEIPAQHHLDAAEVLVNIGIALMKGLAPIEQVQGYLEAATKDCQAPTQVVARFAPRH